MQWESLRGLKRHKWHGVHGSCNPLFLFTASQSLSLQRASKIDYDNWEELGNPGWNWEGLLPYFKKAESYFLPTNEMSFPGTNPLDKAKAEESLHVYHGTQGPLQVSAVLDSLLMNTC